MTVSALMVPGAPSLLRHSRGSTPSLSPRRAQCPSQSAPATNLAGSADPWLYQGVGLASGNTEPKPALSWEFCPYFKGVSSFGGLITH